MFLPTSSGLAGLLVLSACGGEGTSSPGSFLSPQPGATTAAAGPALLCAIGPGAELQSGCSIERAPGSGVIVINHPDGGFRRLIRDPASGELAAADGSATLIREAGPAGEVRFSLGGDRYRIPATLLAAGSP